MQAHLRKIWASKRIRLSHNARVLVSWIDCYKGNIDRAMKTANLGHEGNERCPLHMTHVKFYWDRMNTWRGELKDLGKRILLLTDEGFMYKCMTVLELLRSNGIVMTDAVNGTWEGKPVQLSWDAHLRGPIAHVRVKPVGTAWFRRAGEALYYTELRFNNKMLDLTLEG